MDFQKIVDGINTAACIVSVEKKGDDNYGTLRIVTGNRRYIDSIERPMAQVEMLTRKFVPNSEYTTYLTRYVGPRSTVSHVRRHGKKGSTAPKFFTDSL